LNLLPADFYPPRQLPGYLHSDRIYKVGSRARDREDFAASAIGIRVRHEPLGEVIALLPQGVKLSLQSAQGDWKPLENILQGEPLIKPGWVWKPELDALPDGIYRVGEKATDTEHFAGASLV